MNKIDSSMETAVINMYLDSQMPMYRIAEELKISAGSVYNVCKRNGVKTRPQRNGYMRGKRHSESAKAKISAAHKGKVVSAETKSKLSEAKKLHRVGHKKKRCDGYIALYYPDYPRCTKGGYVMEHVYIMEQFLGRSLTDDEVVHHKNKKRDDNRLENLVLMTKKEHMSMHMKERHANKNKGA